MFHYSGNTVLIVFEIIYYTFKFYEIKVLELSPNCYLSLKLWNLWSYILMTDKHQHMHFFTFKSVLV